MSKVVLALGSNLGDRLGALRSAVNHLKARGWIPLKSSPVFETPPFGYEEQPRFLNACITMECPLEDPLEMLREVKAVETQMGRVQRFKNGPREIDVDILFVDQMVFNSPDLHIPHPGIQERAFVLAPLNCIEPGWVHPSLNLSVSEMLDRVDKNGVIRITNL
ncbi:2-amino-4-hydroxy-6-hydroxymethyldihydropteridine pyrophosphokinase [Thermanaerovibrio velox DSM 12556]|uniref:2-amino-4-hydroxy-6-hydroxymethyldihydropteridine diphosphokinase n=1 Tax=Thermanaerovibrio velox DSM 12556 TaxID=926567 RepID=H0USL5_9BACT|nr:2-amino-4-hydroxy-6-hydroxymethyldihydropteridine diphosphokinase [Thermanaerovibrio velox]EHM10304.1 2-amino-4-hydroxy-6-hydroxymethyldihydropteridine pyrophosphokinase [Thermanaerovibrio velox DSM 12556]